MLLYESARKIDLIVKTSILIFSMKPPFESFLVPVYINSQDQKRFFILNVWCDWAGRDCVLDLGKQLDLD